MTLDHFSDLFNGLKTFAGQGGNGVTHGFDPV